MKKVTISAMYLILATAIFMELLAHGGDIEEYLNNKMTEFPNRPPNIEPVGHQLYQQECSDCHYGYSRTLLPERSWKLLMSEEDLANHFDEVIELEEADRKEIENYLIAGAVDNTKFKLGKKINRSIKKSVTPRQISKIRFIKRQHRDIPDKYISKNAKVISLSQCTACHQRIEEGIVDEDEVYIPYEAIE